MRLCRSHVRAGLAVALLLAACSEQAPAAGKKEAVPPRKVTLVDSVRMAMADTIAVTGTLAPFEELVLGFQVAGRLQELAVDVGDEVAAGAVLAALDPVDFRLGVERAHAALASARARLGLAAEDDRTAIAIDDAAPVREARAVLDEANLQQRRLAELVQKDLRSQADLDAATAAVAVAQSRLQAANDEVRTWIAECRERQVDLELAQKRAQDARLVAPFAGRVALRLASPGRYLQVGEQVLTLMRVDPLRLRLRVPERQAFRVQQDQLVQFTVDGSVGAGDYEGKVTRLGTSIDRDDRTLLVEATVANQSGGLRAGSFCRARIVVDAAAMVTTVPVTAMQSFAGVDRVFTVADGKAVEHLVETGRRQGESIEVVRGLPDGSKVVADPRGLWNGAPVAVGG